MHVLRLHGCNLKFKNVQELFGNFNYYISQIGHFVDKDIL